MKPIQSTVIRYVHLIKSTGEGQLKKTKNKDRMFQISINRLYKKKPAGLSLIKAQGRFKSNQNIVPVKHMAIQFIKGN